VKTREVDLALTGLTLRKCILT